jgi:uncharacterized protein
MRWFLIVAIKIYAALIPPSLRRECIFRDNCSAHVERTARKSGLVVGLRALLERYRNCRPGYRTIYVPFGQRWVLRLPGGAIVNPDDVSSSVRKKLGI